MRLLCIANPEAYRDSVTDIPLSYERLAAHPDIALYHADTRAMLASSQHIAAQPISPQFRASDFATLDTAPTQLFEPGYFDAAFCRTLKPFPPSYLAHLQRWSHTLPFVNDPYGIAQQLQHRFFVDAASAFTPPTLLTTGPAAAADFLAEHGTIVAKRSNSCGGRGVFRLHQSPQGEIACDNIIEGQRYFTDIDTLFHHLSDHEQEPLLLMRYLPRVLAGDRRIVVVDGTIIGSYLRRSTNQHWVQNVSTGGHCDLQPISSADRHLVDATCGPYQAAGIHILGYDLLQNDNGHWLISEINAGNIGGLFRLETLGISGISNHFAQWLVHFANQAGRI